MTQSGQSAGTEARHLYRPLLDQLTHNTLLECSPSLKQTFLQLRQMSLFNIYCNAVAG